MEEADRLLLQAAKLTEILDVFVSDFCDEERVSGEIAGQLIQGLSDLRLERLRGESSSERWPSCCHRAVLKSRILDIINTHSCLNWKSLIGCYFKPRNLQRFSTLLSANS